MDEYKIIDRLYNFTYLSIGDERAVKIIRDTLIKYYFKIKSDAEPETLILKYIYKKGKKYAYRHTYKTDGSVIMDILHSRTYDSRCAVLLRYNIMYPYDKIEKIMGLDTNKIKTLLKDALNAADKLPDFVFKK